MTREETLKHFKIWCQQTLGNNCSDEDLHMANNIIALLEQKPCDDCISRKETIEALMGEWTEYDSQLINWLLEKINKLQPVTPQPKIGKWFIDERPESDREVICSNCEKPIFKYHKLDFDYRPKYCPNCGAKMQEVEENEKT